jgi:hypothetical protein
MSDNYGNSQEKNSALIYEAFSGEKNKKGESLVELEYQVLFNGIKEYIILNENPGINRFDFYLQLEGLELVPTDRGIILLVDKETVM